MRIITLCLLFCMIYLKGESQGYIPEIKNNTELSFICKLYGQTRRVSFSPRIKSDTLFINWELRGAKRHYVVLPEALNNGTGLTFNQGDSPKLKVLKPTETFFMISKAAFKELVKNKKFVYNRTIYVLNDRKDDKAVIIDGKAVDVLHVKAQIDETEFWILNNPEFPLICKIAKNPLGVNYTLSEIQYN